MIELELIRLVNFTVCAVTSMLLFLRINDTLTAFSWPLRVVRLGVVAFVAVVAEGSLEAYYRGAPMTGAAWALLVVCLVIDVGLIVSWRRKHDDPNRH